MNNLEWQISLALCEEEPKSLKRIWRNTDFSLSQVEAHVNELFDKGAIAKVNVFGETFYIKTAKEQQ